MSWRRGGEEGWDHGFLISAFVRSLFTENERASALKLNRR
jgi:hypothetical protein